MSGKAPRRDIKVAKRSKLGLAAPGMAMCAALFLFCTTSMAQAAILWSGNINPIDPTTWTSSTISVVSQSSTGTITIDGGSNLLSKDSYLGYNAGVNGTVTVTGSGSTWTSSDFFFAGYYGIGTLKIESRGLAVTNTSYLGFQAGSRGNAIVTGTDSKWINNGNLYVGYVLYDGSGTLTVSNGGEITTKTLYASLGNLTGDGTITVSGAVLDADITFDKVHGPQPVLAFGTGGTLKLNFDENSICGVGYQGVGTMWIADGIVVRSYHGYLGAESSGASGSATVTGTGSMWTMRGNLYMGTRGNGMLTVANSGAVEVAGSLAVGGQGSSNAGTLNIGDNTGMGLVKVPVFGLNITGICNINNGGKLQVGRFEGISPSFNFNWNDGTIQNYDGNTDLTISNKFIFRLPATGTHAFQIDASRTGMVSAILSDVTTNGTLTKTGEGLLTLSGNNTYTGMTVVEAGTLEYLQSAAITSGPYTVNGGTLDMHNFSKSISTFRIISGTVKGTGTLTSNATYDVQTGTINPRLAGTVGLKKTGAGMATLAGANLYSGGTEIDEGRLKITGSILNTSGMEVSAGATLELAKTSGSATADSLIISNAGTILISAGAQTVGTISGTGVTQVNPGTTLTAKSIVQDSLFVGTAGAATMGGETMSRVPEPGTVALLALGLLGTIIFQWRRSKKG